ncbi:MAG: protein kinase [Coriobacteriia bacterium]|nr:protein kinase [Coriobacteriia bacterium]
MFDRAEPANIVVTAEGAGRLTDFSIALWDDADEAADSLLGSPHYMAPEQILDPRTCAFPADVYALGAVLFEMITGSKAYPGSGVKEILDAHFDTASIPQAPGSGRMIKFCNEALARMLTPSVIDRFQTPRELLEFLEA